MAYRNGICLVLVGVVLVLVVCPTLTCAGVGDYLKMSKLFDYDSYRETFSKRVSPGLEYVSRQRLYLSRALRAYLSGVQYKFWKREDYKAVNPLSDLSPAEIELMKNKEAKPADEKAKPTRKQLQRRQRDEEEIKRLNREIGLPELLPDQVEDVEQELAELISQHGDEPEYADLRKMIAEKSDNNNNNKGPPSGHRRRRRATEAIDDDDHYDDDEREVPLEPRELPRLINTGEGDAPPVEHLPEDESLRSNNPHYERGELISQGLVDQQVKIELLNVQSKDGRPVGKQLASSIDKVKKNAAATKSTKPDTVFVDHRNSKCFLPPRHQKLCAACYAFATIAIMEYVLCKKTRKLTPLSEQYMIDCGKNRVNDHHNHERLNGCRGGGPLAAAKFVHNFGVETQKDYPFLGQDGQCGYGDDFDLTKTGKFRFQNFGVVVSVSFEYWAKYVEHVPIYVRAKTGTGFEEWGGGIDMGNECGSEENHAMVLIGHGRQNGREYWLLRNSYSDKWGEQGYWKLYRGATSKCLSQYGYIFGTKDGITH